MLPLEKRFCGDNLRRSVADREPSWYGDRWFWDLDTAALGGQSRGDGNCWFWDLNVMALDGTVVALRPSCDGSLRGWTGFADRDGPDADRGDRHPGLPAPWAMPVVCCAFLGGGGGILPLQQLRFWDLDTAALGGQSTGGGNCWFWDLNATALDGMVMTQRPSWDGALRS